MRTGQSSQGIMAAMDRTYSFALIILCCRLTSAAVTTPPSQCESLKSPVNGMVQCSRNGIILTCTSACNTGYMFETREKSITRSCNDLTTAWNGGETLPKCVVSPCMSLQLSSVNDSQITASSVWTGVKGYDFEASRGRLESDVTAVGGVVKSGGWRPAENSLDQYIQVELNAVTRITGIVTKGRAVLSGDTANEYVTRFRVLYSKDGVTWEPYSSQTVSDQFFDGNVDNTSPKMNMFTCPFDAKIVRINPMSWHEHISLRFDLYGCPPDNKAPQCLPPVVAPTLPPGGMVTETTVKPTTPMAVVTNPVTSKPVDMCSALPPPTNGGVNCESQSGKLVCVANCASGYIFETGELLVKRSCVKISGAWPAGNRFPACKARAQVTPLPPTHNYTNGCVIEELECNKIGNGDFQACGGCHFFASCSEGYLYVRACPEDLLFDAVYKVCDYHSRSCPGADPSIVG